MAFSKDTNILINKIKKLKIKDDIELENKRILMLSKINEIEKINISNDLEENLKKEFNDFLENNIFLKNKSNKFKYIEKPYNFLISSYDFLTNLLDIFLLILFLVGSGLIQYVFLLYMYSKIIKKNKFHLIQNISLLSVLFSNIFIILMMFIVNINSFDTFGFLFSFLFMCFLFVLNPYLFLNDILFIKINDTKQEKKFNASIIINITFKEIIQSIKTGKLIYNKNKVLKDALLLKILFRNPYLKDSKYTELFENYQIKELMKIVKQKENDKKLILKKQLEENDYIAKTIWDKH